LIYALKKIFNCFKWQCLLVTFLTLNICKITENYIDIIQKNIFLSFKIF